MFQICGQFRFLFKLDISLSQLINQFEHVKPSTISWLIYYLLKGEIEYNLLVTNLMFQFQM